MLVSLENRGIISVNYYLSKEGTVDWHLVICRLFVLKDVPEAWQLEFQDPATSMMEEIILFHDQIMFIIFIILTIVL